MTPLYPSYRPTSRSRRLTDSSACSSLGLAALRSCSHLRSFLYFQRSHFTETDNILRLWCAHVCITYFNTTYQPIIAHPSQNKTCYGSVPDPLSPRVHTVSDNGLATRGWQRETTWLPPYLCFRSSRASIRAVTYAWNFQRAYRYR